MKAQANLIEEIRDERPGYVGARLAKRAVTDCFARGVVRGSVETTNLTLHAGHPDPTRAESIKTAPVTEMALAYPLQLLEALREGRRWPQEPRRTRVDARRNCHRKATDCPFWTIYGGRGKRKEVQALSAYEFAPPLPLQASAASADGGRPRQAPGRPGALPRRNHGGRAGEAEALRRGARCRRRLPDSRRRRRRLASIGRRRARWPLPARLDLDPAQPAARAGGLRRARRPEGGRTSCAASGALPSLGQRRPGRYCAGPLHRRLLGPRRPRLPAGAVAPGSSCSVSRRRR